MPAQTLRDAQERDLRLNQEKLRRAANRSLAEFTKQAWHIIEPHTPLKWNWHLDVICDELEAISADLVAPNPPDLPPHLVINEPPRHMKSILVSVMWPCWEWGPYAQPWTRWMFISHAQPLSTKLSVDRRTIIESRWYQERWGHLVALTTDQNVKTEYQNTKRGVMLATSMRGGKIGRGGHRLVFDDPHDPDDVLSDDIRKADIDRFKTGFSTRLDDKERGAIIIVMQRLHEQDLSAHGLDLGYRHVMLDSPCQEDQVITTRKGRVITRKAGDLLWPAKENEKTLAAMRVALGPYGFAGQYLQRPSPIGGVIFQRHWWKFYKVPPTFEAMAQSWDCAFKGEEDSDKVACVVGGFLGADTYIVDRLNDQLTFSGTCAAMLATRGRFPQTSHTYIEDKANGTAVIDTLTRQVPGLIAVNPQGGKIARAYAVSGYVEAGNVFLPEYLDRQGNVIHGKEWVADFIDRCARFPKIATDDDIDAFTQLIAAHQKHFSAFLQYLLSGKGRPAAAPTSEAATVPLAATATAPAAPVVFGAS